MLQQTTVTAVIPYFERFMTAFPTVAALAAAPEQEVLRLWEGLGYYRRARHLHAAAQQLMRDHPDGLPADPAVWAELPGVGRYILGAVLSQAFELRLPIVEANTLRVLSRLFAYPGDPRDSAGQKWLWEMAEAILPQERIGDFNQAMMELGATVCTPGEPDCGRCPVAKLCQARAQGLHAVIPPRPKAKEIVAVAEVAVVIRKGEKVLLVQRRSDASRWPNMWEVPHAERTEAETVTKAASRIARELVGLKVKVGPELATIRHGVTRFAITLVAVECDWIAGTVSDNVYQAGEWVAPAQLRNYPVSAPQRKLLTELARPRLF